MSIVRDESRMSFAEIESCVVMAVGQAATKLMAELLEARDQALYERRDVERFKVISIRERTVEIVLGFPVTFRRRYYLDSRDQKMVYLLDRDLGLEESTRVSPGLKGLSVNLAVESTSYRKASDAISQVCRQRALSHEAIRQCVLKAGLSESGRIKEAIEDPKGTRKVPIVFLEADGLNIHLQRSGKARVESKILTVHEGWQERSSCKAENELVGKAMYSSDIDREWWDGASRFVHSRYDLTEDTVVVINGDRDQVYRRGVKWFCGSRVLYQVDRYHLKRDLTRILRDKEKVEALIRKADEDPTGQAFMKAVKNEMPGLGKEKSRELAAFVRDVEPIASAVCDYRVRLKAAGIEIEGLKGLGAAEAELDTIADRMKKLGRSWSLVGARAMTQLLCARQSGNLGEVVRRWVEESSPPPEKSRMVIGSIAENALTRARDSLRGGLPVLDAGRRMSGGMSHTLRKIQSGGFRV